MIHNPVEIYQIVEADDFVAVIPASANISQMKHVRLVRCTLDAVPEFLRRYQHARAEGHNITEAHRIALGKAIVVGDVQALPKVTIKGSDGA